MPDIMVPPEAGEARPTFGIGIRIMVKGDRNEPRRNKLLNVITFDIYRDFFTGRAAQPNGE